jgi:hypothetical protein
VARARETILILAAAIAVAGCGGGQPERSGDREAGQERAGRPPALYTVGNQLVGLPGRGPVRLAAAPVAPLAGWLAPAAIPSPDGRYVAYNAWRELRPDDPALSWADQGIELGDPLATPSLRVYDAASGSDSLLEAGAFSFAWRADGALAYFRGAERDYRAGVRYAGDIVVRASLEAPAEVWTPEPGRYVVAAWAGSRLVAYREHEGEALDVVVLDGPGRVRVVAAGSGLVAVSPDGRRLFVEQGPGQGRPTVRVLDVADGHEVAALDLTTVDPAVGAVSYAGDWSGDLVVAPSESGLAIFRVAAGEIALEQALRIDLGDSESGAAEPRFAGPGGERVSAWTSGPNGGIFLDCDRATGTCARVVPVPEAAGVGAFAPWRRPVFNPSRPLAEARA